LRKLERKCLKLSSGIRSSNRLLKYSIVDNCEIYFLSKPLSKNICDRDPLLMMN
jgi:hypothetical protein